jgi:hypothetical protein
MHLVVMRSTATWKTLAFLAAADGGYWWTTKMAEAATWEFRSIPQRLATSYNAFFHEQGWAYMCEVEDIP